MKHTKFLLSALGLALLSIIPAHAATTDLANTPLANATTTTILPNVFFVLDDSGSMDWDYMPDYVNDKYCNDNYDDFNSDKALDSCVSGDPPYNASAFNRVYYNPLVTYTPPKNADGTSKTSYTTWTSVPKDGYGIQSFSSTDLTTAFVERVYCKNSTDVPPSANCKSSLDGTNPDGTYAYPDGTYKYPKQLLGAPFYYNVTVEWCKNTIGGNGINKNFGKSGTCQALKTSTYKYVRYTGWSRVDIKPSTTTYTGPNSTTRTYAEEMTNFANWYAWYRTRMQMMKSSISRTFSSVLGTPSTSDPANSFHARVGFTSISSTGTSGSKFLAIDNFDSTQKSSFYTKLFAADPSPATPLRGALMKAGQMYAGVLATDPVQYSCQRNFTILSTDGFWNTNDETGTYGPYKIDGTDIGDQDGVTGVTRPEFDSLGKADTLADVAYYYYHTDLRPGTCTLCTDNVPPAGTDTAIDDVATHQHMTTFTIGLGVDGTLTYQDGYKTSTSGDFYDIKQGTKNWPDPINNSAEERIDDLWHAAVNGRGTYFSARDPNALVTGLTQALGSIQATSGSGAAAATSNLQPTTGDNFTYIASYRTVSWDGELSAYTIDLSTGAISSTSTWQAASLLASKIASTGNSDTRTIYTWSSGGTNNLKSFLWADMTATEQAYFNNSQLSQYSSSWSSTDQANATGQTLLNYLRGQDRNEDQNRDATYGTYYRLYRDRSNILGDIVHSQPVYVKTPFYDYLDTGYAAFKASQASRAGTVYVAANDGMLHAFNATDGTENWAYIPPMAIKDLWHLADENYTTNHRYFLDGPIAVSDIKDGSTWKTILVGATGKGGRGIYAVDITDPATPKALWNYTADDNANLGYTYGTPLITKLANGTWVVVIASGYNNIPEGSSYATADGIGRVFVLNAATGALIKTISTGVGTTSTPSGLAYLNVRIPDFQQDNTAVQAYGGDLLGNLWRFDLDAGTTSKVVALGTTQPISVAPEIGEIDGNVVLLFGTGRYLGQSDLTLTDTQSFYAIKDDGTTTVSVATQMVKQTMDSSSSRLITGTPVNWASQFGWYFDLPASGERVNLPAQLYFGSAIFSTVVPTNTACQPGGYGFIYVVDYTSGLRVSGATQNVWAYTSPLVGVTVAKLPSGTVKIYGITADGGFPTGTPPTLPVSPGGGGGSDSGFRVMWREILN